MSSGAVKSRVLLESQSGIGSVPWMSRRRAAWWHTLKLAALRGSNCAVSRDEQTPLCLYEAHSGIILARACLSFSDVSLWRKGEAYTLSSTSSNAWSIVPNSYLPRAASERGEEGQEKVSFFNQGDVLVA